MAPADEQSVQNLIVITARKADYVHALLGALRGRESVLSPQERRNLHTRIIRAVAGMQSELFISPVEARTKRLDRRVRLEKLELVPIAEELVRALHQ